MLKIFVKTLLIFILSLSQLSCSSLFKDSIIIDEQNCNTTSVWYYLRKNFKLTKCIDYKKINAHATIIAKDPQYIKQLVQRAGPYIDYIIGKLEQNQLPIEIALLPMIESNFNPFAQSSAGAAGLWQMMPGTATGFGVAQNCWYDGRKDIVDSTNAAIKYLQYLYKLFDSDWLLALAAYNSGEGTIKKAIANNRKNNKPTDFWSLDIPQQTKDYVPRLLALVAIINNPKKYNVTLPSFEQKKYFKIIQIDTQISLHTIAKLANLSLDDIILLNPGYTKNNTSPVDKNKILLPCNSINNFKHNLKHFSHTVNYKVKPKDSLIKIAKQFKVTIQEIQSINKLSNNNIRIGQILVIPNSILQPDDVIQNIHPLSKRNQNNTNIPKHKKILHTVKKNDTYASIAKKYGVSIAAIEFWNKNSHHKPLKLNQTIIIWQKNKTITHVIKKGEVLSIIAKNYQVSVATIMSLNKLKSAKFIKAGQKLIINP